MIKTHQKLTPLKANEAYVSDEIKAFIALDTHSQIRGQSFNQQMQINQEMRLCAEQKNFNDSVKRILLSIFWELPANQFADEECPEVSLSSTPVHAVSVSRKNNL